MTNINNKLFAYIRQASNLSPEIVEQYKNSLIFMGDEKQIYQPLTNSYIGIGTTAYNNLLSHVEYIRNDVLQDLHDNITYRNVVRSISAQWNPDQLPGSTDVVTNVLNNNKEYGSAGNSKTFLRAIGDVTVRGANKFDTKNNFSDIPTYTYSGINVSITHTPVAVEVIEGHDAYGFPYRSYIQTTNSYITIDDTYTWTYIGEKATYLSDFAMQYAREQANKVYKNLLGLNVNYIEKEFNQIFTYNVETGVPNMNTVYAYAYNTTGELVFQELKYGIDPATNNITYLYLDRNNDNAYNNTDVVVARYKNNSWIVEDIISYKDAFKIDYEMSTEDGEFGTRIPVFYEFDESSTSYSNINIADGINTIREVAYILDAITDGGGPEGDGVIALTYNIAYNYREIESLKQWQSEIGKNSVTSFKAEPSLGDDNYISLTHYSVNHVDPTLDDASTGDVMLNANVHIAPIIRGRDIIVPKYNEQTGLLDGTKVLSNVNWATYLGSEFDSPSAYEGFKYEWKYDGNWSSTNDITSTIGNGTSGWVKLDSSNTVDAIKNTFEDPTNRGHYYSGDEFSVFDSGAQYSGQYSNLSNLMEAINSGLINKPVLTNLNDSGLIGNWIYIPWSRERSFKMSSNGVIKALTDVEWVTSYVALSNFLIEDKITSNTGANLKTIFEQFKLRQVTYNNAFKTIPEIDNEGNISREPEFYSLTEDNGLGFRGKYISYVAQVNAYLYAGTEKLPKDLILTHSNITSTDHTYFKIGIHEGITTYKPNLVDPILNRNSSDNLIELGDIPNVTSYLAHQTNTGFTVGLISATSPNNVIDLNNAYYYFDDSLMTYVPVNPLNIGIGFVPNINTGKPTLKIASLPTTGTYYYLKTPSHNAFYISGHTYTNDYGANIFSVSTYITHLKSATSTNTGIADAWDVRSTIEEMFTWIDLDTMAPFVAS